MIVVLCGGANDGERLAVRDGQSRIEIMRPRHAAEMHRRPPTPEERALEVEVDREVYFITNRIDSRGYRIFVHESLRDRETGAFR